MCKKSLLKRKNVLQTVHKSSRRTCEKCFKTYSSRQTLWKHKHRSKVGCEEQRAPSIHLTWNGKCWKTENESLRYQLNLGRDLSLILERGALSENDFNDMQNETINMYKALFQVQS